MSKMITLDKSVNHCISYLIWKVEEKQIKYIFRSKSSAFVQMKKKNPSNNKFTLLNVLWSEFSSFTLAR